MKCACGGEMVEIDIKDTFNRYTEDYYIGCDKCGEVADIRELFEQLKKVEAKNEDLEYRLLLNKEEIEHLRGGEYNG